MNSSLMKWLPLMIIVGLVVILGVPACSTYNSTVKSEEQVKKAWSQVENQYQRRSDLIPNLVSTVKGYANFEQQTLTAVIQARSAASQIKIDPSNLTPEKLQEFEQAQQGIGGALNRLMVLTENYPDLKANQGFLDLQKQLEGTENRITTARKDFNDVVNDYNSSIRTFPNNVFAGMFGFSAKGYFQAAAGSDKAPEVKF